MTVRRLFATAVILSAAAIALHRFCWMPVECNLEIARVEQMTARAVYRSRPSIAIVRARQNLEVLNRISERCAANVNVPMLQAANYGILGRHEDAIAAYEAALLVDRRPEIYLNLGLLELELGQREKALGHLATAVRFDRTMLGAIGDPLTIEEVRRKVEAAIAP